MPIAVPVVDQEITVSAFGKPVVDQVNTLGALKIDAPVDTTIPAGTNTIFYDKTFTVPPTCVGLFCVATIYTAATVACDLLDTVSGAVLASPNQYMTVVTVSTFFPASGSSCRASFRIYAWAGAGIPITGSRSKISLLAVSSTVPALVFP